MSEWAFAVVWIGGPFVVGLVATVLSRRRRPKAGRWMALTGLVLAAGFVVWQYFGSPPSSAPYDGCSDCGNYLGRWWEPQLTIFLSIVGYGLWLLGVGAGIGAAATFRAARRARAKAAT